MAFTLMSKRGNRPPQNVAGGVVAPSTVLDKPAMSANTTAGHKNPRDTDASIFDSLRFDARQRLGGHYDDLRLGGDDQ